MTNIQKSTLVPSSLFDEKTAGCFLGQVAELTDDDVISFVELPEHEAVLIYTADAGKGSVLKELIDAVPSCSQYSKVIAEYVDGALYLVIAQGNSLLLANSYPAEDFTTAQYYIFLAMKNLQLNPEVTTINVAGPLRRDDEMSLYRYFKAVERI